MTNEQTKRPPYRKQQQSAVEKKPEGVTSIQALFSDETTRKQLKRILPKYITPDRYMQVVMTACRKTPKLMKCTPESILQCMMELSATGLEPDGRHAHLIPFDKTKWNPETKQREFVGTICTLIIDYKGYVELALDSEKVSSVHGDVVYEKDFFEYAHGTEPYLKHRPARGDRGNLTEVYTCAKMTDGSFSFEVMAIKEVESIRVRSKTYDKKTKTNSGPWSTDYNEMAKKTCFRRHSKWLPLGKMFRQAESVDADNLNLDDSAPTIQIQMPKEVFRVEDASGGASEVVNEESKTTLVSAGHVESLKVLAKEAGITDTDLIGMALDHGCKKELNELTLENYGKMCKLIVEKQS